MLKVILQDFPAIFKQLRLNASKMVEVESKPGAWVLLRNTTTDMSKRGLWEKNVGDLKQHLETNDDKLIEHVRKVMLHKSESVGDENKVFIWNSITGPDADLSKYLLEQLIVVKNLILGGHEGNIALLSNQSKTKSPWEYPILDPNLLWAAVCDVDVPGVMRAKFLDIFSIWMQYVLKAPEVAGVKLTWTSEEIEADLKSVELPIENDWLKQNMDRIKTYLLETLAFYEDIEIADVDSLTFIESCLNVTKYLVFSGFFPLGSDKTDQLLTHLKVLLDGRSDTWEWAENHSERYSETSQTRPIFQIRLLVAQIINNYYDKRLEDNLHLALRKFTEFRKQLRDDESAQAKRTRTSTTAISKGSREEIDLNVVHQQTGQKKWIMSDEAAIAILMDLLLCERPELKEMAITLLFRTLRPHREVIRTIQKVQLVFDPDTISVFKEVSEAIATIRDKIKDNDASDEDCEIIIPLITRLLKLCCENGGKS